MHHSVRTTRMDGVRVQTSDEIYLHLIERGVSPEALYAAVTSQLHVEIVLTAHPTQVNRRTLQHKLTRVAQLLAQRDAPGLTEEEAARCLEDTRREITALWQTDELRRRKPTPLDGAQKNPARRLFFVGCARSAAGLAPRRAPTPPRRRTSCDGDGALCVQG